MRFEGSRDLSYLLATEAASWRRGPPASAAQLDELRAAVGRELPSSYLALLAWSNGARSDATRDIHVWRAGAVARRNADMHIQADLPATLAFASDLGGDYWYLFDFRRLRPDGECPVLIAEPGDAYEEEVCVAASSLGELVRVGPRPWAPIGGVDYREPIRMRRISEFAPRPLRGLAVLLGGVSDVTPTSLSGPACDVRLEAGGGGLNERERSFLPGPFTFQLASFLTSLIPERERLVLVVPGEARRPGAQDGAQVTEVPIVEPAGVTEAAGKGREPGDGASTTPGEAGAAWGASPERLPALLRRDWAHREPPGASRLLGAVLPEAWRDATARVHHGPDQAASVAELFRESRACFEVWPEGDGLTLYSASLTARDVDDALAEASLAPKMW